MVMDVAVGNCYVVCCVGELCEEELVKFVSMSELDFGKWYAYIEETIVEIFVVVLI